MGANQQSLNCLGKLVQYVFEHRDGLIQGVTYQMLAMWIGRLNKRGVGQAHGMGGVLGRMGHLLQGVEDEWGTPIPHIQSLVVQKTGKFKGLPDEGIREFWTDYPSMTYQEKVNRVRAEHEHIVDFGSRWNDVLSRLNLPQVIAGDEAKGSSSAYGSGGESIQHKNFKEYIRKHPEIVGADNTWISFIEYSLPTCDQIDVVFKSPSRWIAVEAKSSLSDRYPFDYERGLYQTIKYGALLKALAVAGVPSVPSNIASVLVLESKLPEQYRRLAKLLGVRVIEDVGGTTIG